MNLDEYQSAWRADSPPAPLRSEVESLIRRMRRAERSSRVLLSICAVNAFVALLATLTTLLFRWPLPWDEVLPALLLQLLLTAGLVLLIRRRQKGRHALRSAGLTVQEATRTALENVHGNIRDARLMLGLGCIAAPLLALSVSRLIASGKMNTRAALSFASLCALVLGLNAAIQWRRYRRTLVPRRTRLLQILVSLRDETRPAEEN